MGFEDELIGRVHKVMGADQPLPGMELTAAPVQFTSDFGTEEFFGIPKSQVPDLAEKYITWLETSPTPDTCKCEWAVHPDDVNLDSTLCKWCGLSEEAHSIKKVHPVNDPHGSLLRLDGAQVVVDDPEGMGQCMMFEARKRRLRLKDEHPLCPVHNKVGRIAGFFEWLFLVHKEDTDDSDDSARG